MPNVQSANETATAPQEKQPDGPFVTLSEESTAKGVRFPTEEERMALLEKLSKLDVE